MTSAAARRPTCFIAMPMTTRVHEVDAYGGDTEHWLHVMRNLFIPAIEDAGFDAIEPTAQGSDMIHGRIMEHLVKSDMVLCDLSAWNPNVLFELGVRTSLNKPIALVRDEKTEIPFDTNGLNTHRYASSILVWELEAQKKRISDHLVAAAASCDGQNPMWQRFGLALTAEEPSQDATSTDARLDLILAELDDLRRSSGPIRAKFPVNQLNDVGKLGQRIAELVQAQQWHRNATSNGSLHLVFDLIPGSITPLETLKEVERLVHEEGWDSLVQVQEDRDQLIVLLRRPTD